MRCLVGHRYWSVGGGVYHVPNILSTALECVRLPLIIDADKEGLLAHVAPVVLRVLAV